MIPASGRQSRFAASVGVPARPYAETCNGSLDPAVGTPGSSGEQTRANTGGCWAGTREHDREITALHVVSLTSRTRVQIPLWSTIRTRRPQATARQNDW